MIKLHIDIETRSSVNLKTSGAYKYANSPDFSIILIAYYYEDTSNNIDTIHEYEVEQIDLLGGEQIPAKIKNDILDPNIIKVAHNANFERIGFSCTFDQLISAFGWECTMALAAYNGLPLKLEDLTETLPVEEGKIKHIIAAEQKPRVLKDGTRTWEKKISINTIMKFFSSPSGKEEKLFNDVKDNPYYWWLYKIYNKRDVTAEFNMKKYFCVKELPPFEKEIYVIDAEINDKGVGIDVDLIKNASIFDDVLEEECKKEGVRLTGIVNFNSDNQMKAWLSSKTGEIIEKVDKEAIKAMLDSDYIQEDVKKILRIRKQMKKTSNKKYKAIINMLIGTIVRGCLLYYGANRTGRWAGRGVQLHNLPKNYTKHVTELRIAVKTCNRYLFDFLSENPRELLSELIRTSFVPTQEGFKFFISDYSAIEARVLACLAGCKWRQEVFAQNGDIYITSAAKMFRMPEAEIKKSGLRSRGKIYELALGYEGSLGAVHKMGKDTIKKMGITDTQIKFDVAAWRKESKEIPELWRKTKDAAIKAVIGYNNGANSRHCVNKYLSYECVENYLICNLPSGRQLLYYKPHLVEGKYGPEIRYSGYNDKNKWTNDIKSYGGKLIENATQAIARDCLAVCLHKAVRREGLDIRMHVHDEVIGQCAANEVEINLKKLNDIMSETLEWMPDLILNGEGFVSDFYMKEA